MRGCHRTEGGPHSVSTATGGPWGPRGLPPGWPPRVMCVCGRGRDDVVQPGKISQLQNLIAPDYSQTELPCPIHKSCMLCWFIKQVIKGGDCPYTRIEVGKDWAEKFACGEKIQYDVWWKHVLTNLNLNSLSLSPAGCLLAPARFIPLSVGAEWDLDCRVNSICICFCLSLFSI